MIGLEPTTFTLATCGRWFVNRYIPKSYGAGEVNLHCCLLELNEVLERRRAEVARCNLSTHRCDHEPFDAFNPVDETKMALFACPTKQVHISTSLTNGRPQFFVFHASKGLAELDQLH